MQSTYDALREAGVEKALRADQEDPARNPPRRKKSDEPPVTEVAEQVPNITDAPNQLLTPMDDVVAGDTIHDEPTGVGIDDVYNVYEKVDRAVGDDLDVDWDEEKLQDSSNDHMMSSLVCVLQMSGVCGGCGGLCFEGRHRPSTINDYPDWRML